jgi:hypothetical protein
MFRYRISREKNGEYVYEIDTDGVELLHNPIRGAKAVQTGRSPPTRRFDA